ncbi:MAG TPA: hypothetical protein VMB18_01165 [Terriglobales bacterium]|nr:hypothetical protein [Terriglobales bacterium]
MKTAIYVFAPLLCIGVIVSAADGSSSTPPATIAIQISASPQVADRGKAIEVNIVVKNISSQMVPIWRSNGKDQAEISGYLVRVSGPHGRPVPKTRYYKIFTGEPVENMRPEENIHTSGGPTFSVQPGATLKDEFLLNRLFDLSTPETYSIQIERKDPVSGLPVKSNSIEVVVKP